MRQVRLDARCRRSAGYRASARPAWLRRPRFAARRRRSSRRSQRSSSATDERDRASVQRSALWHSRPFVTRIAARRSDRAATRAAPDRSRRTRRSPSAVPKASATAPADTTVRHSSSRVVTPDGHEAERDADEAADDAERDGLDQELDQHVAAARAHRHAQADLARPLGHRHEHDVHDPDAADDERDRRRCWRAAPSACGWSAAACRPSLRA